MEQKPIDHYLRRARFLRPIIMLMVALSLCSLIAAAMSLVTVYQFGILVGITVALYIVAILLAAFLFPDAQNVLLGDTTKDKDDT